MRDRVAAAAKKLPSGLGRITATFFRDFPGHGYPCGLLLLGVWALWAKVESLGSRLSSSGMPSYRVQLAWQDSSLLVAIGLLTAVSGMSNRRFLRRASEGSAFLLLAWYYLDAFSMRIFHERATLVLVSYYLTKWDLYSVWLSLRIALGIAGAFFVWRFCRIGRCPRIIGGSRVLLAGLGGTAVLAVGVGTLDVAEHDSALEVYAFDADFVLDSGAELLLARKAAYAAEAYVAGSGEMPPRQPADLPSGTPNIILLIVESLSSADSFRSSGLGRRLPHFDRISEQGVLFVNHIGNGRNSFQGMVALLHGELPVPFPGVELRYGFTEEYLSYFAHQEAAIHDYLRRGYRGVFLTNFTWYCDVKLAYMRSLGLETDFAEVGPVPRAPREQSRVGWPDESLYLAVTQSVERLRSERRPYFLVAETAGSHLPAWHPADFEAPPSVDASRPLEVMWSYVDQQLGSFFDTLESQDFFSNGILIVTGDHRRMGPVSNAERAVYGESAVARTALTIVGKDVPRGVIDTRLWQHSDLLSMLGRATESHRPLSQFAFHGTYLPRELGSLRLFLPPPAGLMLESYTLHLEGMEIRWDEPRPAMAPEVERQLRDRLGRLAKGYSERGGLEVE